MTSMDFIFIMSKFALPICIRALTDGNVIRTYVYNLPLKLNLRNCIEQLTQISEERKTLIQTSYIINDEILSL